MHKIFLKTAALLAAFGVALGAFGAHQLKSIFAESIVNIFETAIRYLFYHVFALFIVAILYQQNPNKTLKIAGILFVVGIILFSGSLFLITYKEAMVLSGLKWVGPITPLGGVCFIAGWICLALGIKK